MTEQTISTLPAAFSFAQAAKYIGVSRWTLWREIKAGNLKPHSRLKIISRAELDRFLSVPAPAPVAFVAKPTNRKRFPRLANP